MPQVRTLGSDSGAQGSLQILQEFTFAKQSASLATSLLKLHAKPSAWQRFAGHGCVRPLSLMWTPHLHQVRLRNQVPQTQQGNYEDQSNSKPSCFPLGHISPNCCPRNNAFKSGFWMAGHCWATFHQRLQPIVPANPEPPAYSNANVTG